MLKDHSLTGVVLFFVYFAQFINLFCAICTKHKLYIAFLLCQMPKCDKIILKEGATKLHKKKEGKKLAINTKDIIKKFIKTEFPGKEVKKLTHQLREAISDDDKLIYSKTKKYEWKIKGDRTIIYSLEYEEPKLVCDINTFRFLNLVKAYTEGI